MCVLCKLSVVPAQQQCGDEKKSSTAVVMEESSTASSAVVLRHANQLVTPCELLLHTHLGVLDSCCLLGGAARCFGCWFRCCSTFLGSSCLVFG